MHIPTCLTISDSCSKYAFTPFRVYFYFSILFLYPKGCIDINMSTIGDYIKEKGKEIGLRFVRELEQDKETVRLDKVNQALSMFGKEAVPGDRKES